MLCYIFCRWVFSLVSVWNWSVRKFLQMWPVHCQNQVFLFKQRKVNKRITKPILYTVLQKKDKLWCSSRTFIHSFSVNTLSWLGSQFIPSISRNSEHKAGIQCRSDTNHFKGSMHTYFLNKGQFKLAKCSKTYLLVYFGIEAENMEENPHVHWKKV